MAFDSGYSSEAVIFVLTAWAFLPVCLIFSILAWIYYKKEKYKLSLILMAVPLLYVLFYALILSLPALF
ncbi:MAG: hypothetical protein CVV24_06015 [Ignavibacteriae bacterium HGW-Ignavibacteriae-3]|nr:MAG: hypothetical protein CVV24_06015 [Ignavibacteriae bacterium HGW-Ignavibacteriae-3]